MWKRLGQGVEAGDLHVLCESEYFPRVQCVKYVIRIFESGMFWLGGSWKVGSSGLRFFFWVARRLRFAGDVVRLGNLDWVLLQVAWGQILWQVVVEDEKEGSCHGALMWLYLADGEGRDIGSEDSESIKGVVHQSRRTKVMNRGHQKSPQAT